MIKRKLKNKKSMLKSIDSDKSEKRKEFFKKGSRLETSKNKSKDSIPQIQSNTNYINGHENSLANAASKTHVDKLNTEKITIKPNPKNKIKTQRPLCRHNHIKATKPIDKACFKKVSINNKFAMETESVKTRCKLLAQKTEEFIKQNKRNPEVFINENVQCTSSNFIKNNKKIAIHAKVNEIVIHEYIPLPPKSNNDNQADNNGRNTLLFKSNYDLLQTIISSQHGINNPGQSINSQLYSIPEKNIQFIPKVTKLNRPPVKVNRYRAPSFREVNDPAPFQAEIPNYSSRVFDSESDLMRVPSLRTQDINLKPFAKKSNNTIFLREAKSDSNLTKARESDDQIIFQSDTPYHNVRPSLQDKGSFSALQADTDDSNIRPYLMRASDDTSPIQVATFQSHNYKQDFHLKTDVYNFNKKPRNFITTQSRENFINFSENITFKTNKINLSKPAKPNNHKKKEKSTKIFDMENNTVKGIRDSYTIEFTENNELNFRNNNSSRYDMLSLTNQMNLGSIEALTPSMNYIFNDPRYQCVPPNDAKSLHISKNNIMDSDLVIEPLNTNTYTITNSCRDSNHENCWNRNRTFTIENVSKLCYTNKKSETTQCFNEHANRDTQFVFVSKSQDDVNDDERQIITHPIDVCETVLTDQELSEDRKLEFDIRFNSKSDSCNNFNANSNAPNEMGDLVNRLNDNLNIDNPRNDSCDKNYATEILNQEELTERSHHFTIPNSNTSKKQSPIIQDAISKAGYDENTTSNEQNKDVTIASEFVTKKNDTEAFIIKNRMCFVPKGNA